MAKLTVKLSVDRLLGRYPKDLKKVQKYDLLAKELGVSTRLIFALRAGYQPNPTLYRLIKVLDKAA